ncbi:MAG: tRNA (cytidine(34)-2'-O)-methyltransferase [Alphaproteobacteria bacterium]
MRIALYQPDIPQNAGAVLRLGACLGIEVDIVEPAGFVMSDKHLKRAGMDYLDHVRYRRHASWPAFLAALPAPAPRLVLATTNGKLAYTEFSFRADDILLFGRESAGVPEDVHARCDARVVIPLRRGLRSINVAQAAAMIVGEALRQTNLFPAEATAKS